MSFLRLVIFLCLSVLGFRLWAADGELKTQPLGDFTLISGEVIKDCKLGYRTFGTLNADRANAILWPTWFTGSSANLVGMIGPGKLADSSRYFVIAVDALGNGVSSSPSNSSAQPLDKFPKFTIRDMVNSQRELVRTLGIERLHAVMGISMGGMQTFEWLVSYPEMMNLAVPIIGSPRLSTPDLLLWQAELSAIDAQQNCRCDLKAAMKAVAAMHAFALYTPGYHARENRAEEFGNYFGKRVEDTLARMHPLDWAAQLRAMLAQDVTASFQGSMEVAAGRVKARTLVVVAKQDHMVNPQTATEFARAAGAQLLELSGDCGHMATACETAVMTPAVRAFLGQ